MPDKPRRRQLIRLTRTEELKLAAIAAKRQSHWTRRLALRIGRRLIEWSAR